MCWLVKGKWFPFIIQVIETYACSGISSNTTDHRSTKCNSSTLGLHVYQCGTEMEDLIFGKTIEFTIKTIITLIKMKDE